jgi:DNA-binding PadR family transcriptional regulator
MKRRNVYSLPELPDKKKMVLLFFADRGEANAYEVSEACRLEYSTAYSSVKALEKEASLTLKSEKLNEKRVIAKTYEITTKGVHRCLCAKLPWHEKVVIVEKRQSLLKPNVLEWMKFIEVLDDSNIEEMVSSNISGFLKVSEDMGYFLDVIDESSFDAVLVTMIDFDGTYAKVMRIIDSFPRLKARLLRLLRDDIAWREKDLDRYRQIKAELEKI